MIKSSFLLTTYPSAKPYPQTLTVIRKRPASLRQNLLRSVLRVSTHKLGSRGYLMLTTEVGDIKSHRGRTSV